MIYLVRSVENDSWHMSRTHPSLYTKSDITDNVNYAPHTYPPLPQGYQLLTYTVHFKDV